MWVTNNPTLAGWLRASGHTVLAVSPGFAFKDAAFEEAKAEVVRQHPEETNPDSRTAYRLLSRPKPKPRQQAIHDPAIAKALQLLQQDLGMVLSGLKEGIERLPSGKAIQALKQSVESLAPRTDAEPAKPSIPKWLKVGFGILVLLLLSVLTARSQTVVFQDEGVERVRRAGGQVGVNFAGAGVSCAANVAGITTCTISGGGATGYQTIEDEGSALTQRTVLNLIGAGVSCVDSGAPARTDCTISGGGGGSWSDLTDPTAVVVLNSDAVAELFQARFTATYGATDILLDFQQLTGNPVAGSEFMRLTVNDPDMLPFAINDGTNTVFQVERDADTTIRNFTDQQVILTLDSGTTTQQVSKLTLSDQGTPRWDLQKSATGELQFVDVVGGINRFQANDAGGDNLYRSGGVNADHLFESSTTLRVTIHGDADKISFGSAADTSIERFAANILGTVDQLEVRDGSGNSVFQVQTDGDTTIRNFTDQELAITLSSGTTGAQALNLNLNDRAVNEWQIQKPADNSFRINEVGVIERLVFSPASDSFYRTGSATSDHIFADNSGGISARILGDAETICIGATEDACLTRTSDPNTVLGLAVTAGSVFGLPVVAGDPNTATWGTGQDGRTWFDSTGNLSKFWDGAAIRTVIHRDTNTLLSTESLILDGSANPRDTTLAILQILQTPNIASTHGIAIITDAAGFGDTKSLEIDWTATGVVAGDFEAVIVVDVDTANSTGGNIIALEVTATDTGSATVYGMLTGVGVNPILNEAGSFINIETAFTFDSVFTDVTADFNSTGSDVQMFVSNGDLVYIGMAALFDEVEFILAVTASNAGIQPTFEYSDGASGWITFSPTDNTNGMRQNGDLVWIATSLAGWAQDTVNAVSGKFWIRITRGAVTVATPPTEDLVQVNADLDFMWDSSGNLNVASVSSGFNAEIAEDGFIKVGNTEDVFCSEIATPGTDLCLQLDGSDIWQIDGTFNAATLTESTNAVPNSTDKLDFFSATTVAELATVLSDEDFTPGSETSAEGVLDVEDLQTALTAARCVRINAGGTALEAAAADCNSGGGLTHTVNGSALASATAIDFDDSLPAAPASSVNINWAKDALDPTNVSASILLTEIDGIGIGVSGTELILDNSQLTANQVFWTGASASRTITFSLSGATDPVLTFSDSLISSSVALDAPSFTGTGSNGFIEFPNSSAAVAPANTGRLRYNSTAQKLELSENLVAYAAVTQTQSFGTGNCAEFDANGDVVDSGAGCGGGSGDNITVLGVAVTDANFSDTNPAAPTNSVLVNWATDAAPTPDDISASILLTEIDGIGIAVSGTELVVDNSELTANQLFWTGASASRTFTFALSGATDPVLTLGNDSFDVSTGVLQEGGVNVVVETLTLTGGSGIETIGDLSTNRTIQIDLNATVDGVGSSSNLSGMEFTATGELALLQDCATGQILKYTTTGDLWECQNDNDSGGSPAWEALVNTADTATSYVSTVDAETVTFDFQSAFSTDRFIIKDTTGNPTAGTLLQVTVTDPQVEGLRVEKNTTDEGSFFNVSNSNTASRAFIRIISDTAQGGIAAYGSTHATAADETWFWSAGASGKLLLRQDGAKPIEFWTNGSEQGTISSAGAWTIGGSLEAGTLTEGGNAVPNSTESPAAGDISGTYAAGLTVDSNAVTNAILRDSAGFSVIGKTATGSGDPADIVAADETVFGRTGAGNLVFAQVATGQMANQAITFVKMQNIATDRLMGRDTAATGSPEEIALNVTLEFDGSLNLQRAALTGDVTASAGSNATLIAAGVVASAELATANKTFTKSIVVIDPTTTEDDKVQWMHGSAVTYTSVNCSTDTGTATIDMDHRVLTTPNTVGTDILTGTIVCDTNNQADGGFADATIPADVPVNLSITAVASTPGTVRIHITYTKD